MIRRLLKVFLIEIYAILIGAFFALPVMAGTAIVSWNANTEPDLAGYNIYYDTVSRASTSPAGYTFSYHMVGTTSTTHTFSSLTDNLTYYFAVTAYDTSNNESVCSSEQSKLIAPPVLSAGAPSGLLATGTTQTTLTLITDEKAICKYSTSTGVVYSSMTKVFEAVASTSHTVVVTGLTDSQTYHYYVRCADEAGNVNNSDYTIMFGVGSGSDLTLPSVPTNLQATVNSSTQISLTWTPSIDNIAVLGYKIYRNNVFLAQTATNSYSNTGLSAATLYSYRVSAYDAAGNDSALSATSSATTQAAVVTPVVSPGGSGGSGGGSFTAAACTSWTYSVWTSCVAGKQARTILTSLPGGCSGGAPILTQTCGSIIASSSVATSTRPSTSNPVKPSVAEKNTDSDGDGLVDSLEVALGLNANKKDSDGDGYNDRTEIISDNNPKGKGKLFFNLAFSAKNAGKILLQVQSKGEAWYVNPLNLSRYYLGKPTDAFAVMRKLGMGVKHSIITQYSKKLYPDRFSGRILLDVEDGGKAYFINPKDHKAYYLGRPTDAFAVMRKLGNGITNTDLDKIKVKID
ncbi:MAG: fibronectin type III domain-containing protein [bacterium]